VAGYRRIPKTYVLKFEEHPGLEVVTRSVSVEELLKVQRVAVAFGEDSSEANLKELFGWFIKRLTGWNLEDENGRPIPPTLASLLAEDFDFALKLVMAWVEAVTPGKAGTPAETVPESSIPMSTASTPGT
jgi:hypothetical protein